MTNLNKVKAKFYEDLHLVTAAVPMAGKLIILGDFNARVSSENIAWEGGIGKYGVGHCNSNGLLLLQTCAEHDLLMTNTMFCLPTHNNTSRMHPRSNQWYLIMTKTMCGAECWTDHRLLISNLSI